jgi:hypothetical protein
MLPCISRCVALLPTLSTPAVPFAAGMRQHAQKCTALARVSLFTPAALS